MKQEWNRLFILLGNAREGNNYSAKKWNDRFHTKNGTKKYINFFNH